MWRLKLYRGAWYAVSRINGQTVRRALRTTDKAVAERSLADILAQPVTRPGDDVASIVRAYIADRAAAGVRRVATMRSSLPHLEAAFGPLRPDQITADRVRAYAKARGQGRSTATVRSDLETLRAALKSAKATGWEIPMPAPPDPRDRYLTRAEFTRLLRASKPYPHLRLFIVLALTTGARAEAILQLTWDRVDFGRGLIAFRGQGAVEAANKRRGVKPMTRRARAHLTKARSMSTCSHVIEWGGRPVKSIKKAFASAVRAAGLPGKVSAHTLKHTAGAWLAEAGVPMSEIAQMLDHTSTAMTERVYARYSPGYLARSARALG